VIRRPRRFWPLYLGWVLLCALLFAGLRHAEDPSRPEGRVLPADAGRRALVYVEQRGLRGYEVVHVARARRGEGGNLDRWVVLLDKVPHTRLNQAVVVEMDDAMGQLVAIRKPER
jgi:hypothetical protein